MKKCLVLMVMLCAILCGCTTGVIDSKPKDSSQKTNDQAAHYNRAIKLYENGDFEAAFSVLRDLGDYKDAKEYLIKVAYSLATAAKESGDLRLAALRYGICGNYQDAEVQADKLWDRVAKRRIVDVGCYYVIAVSDDGMVLLNGDNVIGEYAEELSSWNNLIAIAGGDWVAAGLRKDGTVVAAGDGVSSVEDWRDIVSIEAGNDAIAGLRKDGTVVCTDKKLNKIVSKWSDVVAIDMESSYIIGLRHDGTVLCSAKWDMSNMTDIVQIAAGDQHCAGLRSDGTVVAVGDGVSGSNAGLEVGEWTDIVPISAASFITYGVKSDGTVVSTGSAVATWGQDYGLHRAESWHHVESISSSYINVVCIHKDGTVSAITHAGQADLNHANWNLYK